MVRRIIHIKQLSAGQVSQARRWVIFSIFIVFFAQSTLTFLFCFSVKNPEEFSRQNASIEKKVALFEKELQKKLLDLLDFGQKPTQKKQTSVNLAFSFNLFVEDIDLAVNPAQGVNDWPQRNYAYKNGYFQDFYAKIIHPPQVSV
ncbi:hypothetical protein [Emticicia sp. TH156]|uniref:hypothetical protein n=1 Tax=Emticicia sp. TH156 TaxID=2067454 RepID=UPI000C77E338|nr:hypothetical protein [Emticicia sp. TH156]PLK44777.1 hypothetical protein C0V77_10040 [Emticicia sp. TH156]